MLGAPTRSTRVTNPHPDQARAIQPKALLWGEIEANVALRGFLSCPRVAKLDLVTVTEAALRDGSISVTTRSTRRPSSSKNRAMVSPH